jgi:hypothetical protein
MFGVPNESFEHVLGYFKAGFGCADTFHVCGCTILETPILAKTDLFAETTT